MNLIITLLTSVLVYWSPNTEDDLAGYTVYYSQQSGDYAKSQWVGLNTELVVDSLQDGTWYFAVTASDHSGNESDFSKEVSITLSNTEDEQRGDAMNILDLKVYPNPVSTSITIEYELSKDSHVLITVYNTLGQKVLNILNTTMREGRHTISWNTGDHPQGVYIIQLITPKGSKSVQVVKITP